MKDEFKNMAVTEMKHAESIVERLVYLGGNPTTKPEPIFVGKNLKEMVERNKKDEEGAIKLYKQIIKVAEDEEDHHDTFTTLLEEI